MAKTKKLASEFSGVVIDPATADGQAGVIFGAKMTAKAGILAITIETKDGKYVKGITSDKKAATTDSKVLFTIVKAGQAVTHYENGVKSDQVWVYDRDEVKILDSFGLTEADKIKIAAQNGGVFALSSKAAAAVDEEG